ncbi:hypothetical protein GCM10009647_065850 [Streptomyces sanglieri]
MWINDLQQSLATLGTLLGLAGRVDVAASCSLLHVPLDLAAERDIDPQVGRRLAFARQKSAEIATLTRGLARGTASIAAELAANRADLASPAGSAITHDPAVRARTPAVTGPKPGVNCPVHNGRWPSAPGSGYRCCRRPRSARSRRPPTCAAHAPI